MSNTVICLIYVLLKHKADFCNDRIIKVLSTCLKTVLKVNSSHCCCFLSVYKKALFPIWGDSFFRGTDCVPRPLQPGTTRCDITPVRESQRPDGVGLFFGKIFALPSRFFAEWQSKSFAGLAIFGGEQALFLYTVTLAYPVVKIYFEILPKR